MSLLERLKRRILADGPMTVADYMSACLHDPTFGYYATRPRLGERGDFVTAPLVSQMFGELIGLWAVETWARMGAPAPFRLVEVGPGDGTLMADVLRAARLAPAFPAAAEVFLVETSAPLRAAQVERLAGREIRWTTSLDEVPESAPMILIANEVLDCLPARQFVRTQDGWAERRVGLGEAGRLVFGLAPAPSGFIAPIAAEFGQVVEVSLAQEAFAAAIAARVAADGGAALLIDYGRDHPEVGDTLQAMFLHQNLPPLASPGEADLTVHADFPSVAAAARRAGAQTTAIRTQDAFLRALGVEQRAAALTRAHPDRAETIARQLHRLIGAEEMGELFKVLGVHSAGLALPGFDVT